MTLEASVRTCSGGDRDGAWVLASIRAPELPAQSDRPPLAVHLVIDESGSMACGHGR